jgi:hypothetical protein
MRRTAAVLTAAALMLGVAGCRQTANLSKQEVVVQFTPTATQADHARVWALCQNLPGVAIEPLDTTSKYPATLLYNVRYRTDHATNYQLQQLYNCLQKDPSVAGVTPGESSDN